MLLLARRLAVAGKSSDWFISRMVMDGPVNAKKGVGYMTKRLMSELPEEKSMAPELLQSHYESYTKQDPKIREGALVQWKDWMKNRSTPAYGEPAIVVKVLDEPILFQDSDPDSPSYLEHLDMVLGVLGEDSEFIVRCYDSNRFKAYEAE